MNVLFSLSYSHTFVYIESCCRKSSEEILEGHIHDLRKQITQRDDMIDKLRSDIYQLKEEHKSSVEQVMLELL